MRQHLLCTVLAAVIGLLGCAANAHAFPADAPNHRLLQEPPDPHVRDEQGDFDGKLSYPQIRQVGRKTLYVWGKQQEGTLTVYGPSFLRSVHARLMGAFPGNIFIIKYEASDVTGSPGYRIGAPGHPDRYRVDKTRGYVDGFVVWKIESIIDRVAHPGLFHYLTCETTVDVWTQREGTPEESMWHIIYDKVRPIRAPVFRKPRCRLERSDHIKAVTRRRVNRGATLSALKAYAEAISKHP